MGAPAEPLTVLPGAAPKGFAFGSAGRDLVVLDRTDRVTVWELPE